MGDAHAANERLILTTQGGVDRMKLAFKRTGGLILVCLGAYLGYDSWFRPASEYAIVTADLHRLRAPISGVLSHKLRAGQRVQGPLGSIDDRWFDDSRLQQVQAEARATLLASGALELHQKELVSTEKELKDKGAQRKRLRSEQLKALLLAQQAELEASTHHAQTASLQRTRTAQLTEAGISSVAMLDEAILSQELAQKEVEKQEAAKASLVAAEGALQGGLSLSNATVGDVDYTEQKRDDVRLQLLNLKRESAVHEADLDVVYAELGAEETRAALMREAELRVDTPARVWKLRATTGEFVTRGDEVAELVLCETLKVYALVSKRTFNSIRMGDAVRFLPDGGGKAQAGSVVQLLGPWESSSPSRLQLTPTSLPDKYGVLVALSPEDSARYDCSIGQTGRVYFE